MLVVISGIEHHRKTIIRVEVVVRAREGVREEVDKAVAAGEVATGTITREKPLMTMTITLAGSQSLARMATNKNVMIIMNTAQKVKVVAEEEVNVAVIEVAEEVVVVVTEERQGVVIITRKTRHSRKASDNK